jgi:uroporphyrinogen decarboxylase
LIKLKGRDRVLKAAELKVPDMVPVTDLGIEPPLIEAVTGIRLGSLSTQSTTVAGEDSWQNALRTVIALMDTYSMLGFDAAFFNDYSLVAKTTKSRFINESIFIDEWGRILKNDYKTKTTWWYGGTIRSEEDLDKMQLPSAYDEGRFEIAESAVKRVKKDLAVGAAIHTGFTLAWEVRGGIDKFIIDIYRKPAFARKLLNKFSNTFYEFAKMIIDAGIDILAITDDYCDSKGPIISPKIFKEWELPNIKRIADLAKKKGIPLLKHTDGNAYLLIDDMIDAGINGLHPIEPGSMNLADVKKRYGQRIFLAGNVDCRYVLPFGSEEDVRKEVRRCIDEAADGGGFILASSNSLHANVKLENVKVMIDEARKYGKYPLK